MNINEIFISNGEAVRVAEVGTTPSQCRDGRWESQFWLRVVPATAEEVAAAVAAGWVFLR